MNIIRKNNKTYFIIDFNNKKIIDKDMRKLFILAHMIARDVQKRTGYKVSGYVTLNVFN